jgi:hypothetical protein
VIDLFVAGFARIRTAFVMSKFMRLQLLRPDALRLAVAKTEFFYASAYTRFFSYH